VGGGGGEIRGEQSGGTYHAKGGRVMCFHSQICALGCSRSLCVRGEKTERGEEKKSGKKGVLNVAVSRSWGFLFLHIRPGGGEFLSDFI